MGKQSLIEIRDLEIAIQAKEDMVKACEETLAELCKAIEDLQRVVDDLKRRIDLTNNDSEKCSLGKELLTAATCHLQMLFRQLSNSSLYTPKGDVSSLNTVKAGAISNLEKRFEAWCNL